MEPIPPCRFVPLGGLGEIGMNCMAIELGDDRIVLDFGLGFDGRGLGVDVLHADISYITREPEKLRAILVTHGHEDHIGAVPYLLAECPVPVYGPAYAIELLKNRLAWDAPDLEPELHVIAPGDRLRFGGLDVEPFRVTHSMPDCTGIILRTPHGVVVHTGDFKVDDDPTDGQPIDFARLAEVRDAEGIRLLLSDSTNAMAEGSSGPERDVARRLEEIVAEAPARVCVTLFASNVHRLRSLTEIARATGRKLCLLGRSLQNHARIAHALGHLPDLGDIQIGPEEARACPRGRLLVLATGTQGEPPAAFARLAKGEHPDLDLEAGDRVIHSARIIPGHETEVYELINTLERRGVEVIWRLLDRGIHASGHAHRGEQRRMIEHLAPRSFLPVHGTFLHLKSHAELARGCGVEDVLVVENGAIVELDDGPLRVGGTTPTGRIYRERGRPVEERVIRDRALLAELGVAVVTALVDDRGRPTQPLDLLTRGICHEDDCQPLLDGACEYVHDALASRRWRVDRPEIEDVEAEARRALKRFFSRQLRKKPLCYAVVMRP